MSLNISSTFRGFQTPTTSIPALTTPFIPSPSCHTVLDLLNTTTLSYLKNGTYFTDTTVPFLFSNPANTEYVQCQPTQYTPGPQQHSYSPGVCPLGWNYLYLATAKTPLARGALTTARCCQSGYNLEGGQYGGKGDGMCTRQIGGSHSTFSIPLPNRESPTTTTAISSGIRAHPAWYIAWRESDVATLSPQPPTLTSDMLLYTWIPGQTLLPGANDNQGAGQPVKRFSGTLQLAIGIPLVICALIVVCGGCCVWKKQDDRKTAVGAAAASDDTVVLANPVDHGQQGGQKNGPRGAVDTPPVYAMQSMTPMTR